jgi:ABC-2 type transport system ATP-binding protein
LWATHLIDEVLESDHVIVLHKGTVRAQGRVSAVAKAAGAPNIAEAFAALTHSAARNSEAGS